MQVIQVLDHEVNIGLVIITAVLLYDLIMPVHLIGQERIIGKDNISLIIRVENISAQGLWFKSREKRLASVGRKSAFEQILSTVKPSKSGSLV